MIMKKLTVHLDFDGTVVEHRFPALGAENRGWGGVVKKLQDAGHEVVLNTYRADVMQEQYALKQLVTEAKPDYMQQAEAFLAHNGHCMASQITSNPKKVQPVAWPLMQEYARLHGLLFLDDQALGMLLRPCKFGGGTMVDWPAVDEQLERLGFYAPVTGG